MKTYITYIYLGLMLLGSHLAFGQQEPLYTQFMYNKLALNPAYAGSFEKTQLTALMRSQWIGFPGAPKSVNFSANIPIANQTIGLGINATRQTIGITTLQYIDGAYSYRFKTQGSGTFSIGLQSTIRRYTQNFGDPSLIIIDGIATDPLLPKGMINKNLVNFGAGVYYRDETFYVGLSVPRLTQANLSNGSTSPSLAFEERTFYLMGGGTLKLNNEWSLTPQAIVRYNANSPLDWDINASLTYDKFLTMGLNYRAGGGHNSIGESIDALVSVQMAQGIMLGVAYDYTLSNLRNQSSGSLEAVIQYTFGQENKAIKEVNPRFF